jgi:hypothetical protein
MAITNMRVAPPSESASLGVEGTRILRLFLRFYLAGQGVHSTPLISIAETKKLCLKFSCEKVPGVEIDGIVYIGDDLPPEFLESEK